MKRELPVTSSAPAAAGSSKAGSNWKALKKTLDADASSTSKRSTSVRPRKDYRRASPDAVTATSAAAVIRRAPTALPWFAEDISLQDLELVRQSAMENSAAEGSNTAALELRKQAILQGVPETASDAKQEVGKYLAIDCEMVGVGYKGEESMLARVSLVNFHGATVLDRFVKPKEKVTDYRTWVSGVQASDLQDAPSFAEVQGEVATLIRDRILVGHAIHNDLKALLLDHPRAMIRDTATFQPLRLLAKTKYPSLKKLAKLVLDIDIQMPGESHSPLEDARATMAVFRSQKETWDKTLDRTQGKRSASNGAKIWQPLTASKPLITHTDPSSLRIAAAKLKVKKAAEAGWWKDTLA